MSFRRAVFWSVVAVVEAILILWILSLAVFTPKPEPIALGKAEVLPLTGVSTVAAITPPAQESPVVKIGINAGHRIGK